MGSCEKAAFREVALQCSADVERLCRQESINRSLARDATSLGSELPEFMLLIPGSTFVYMESPATTEMDSSSLDHLPDALDGFLNLLVQQQAMMQFVSLELALDADVPKEEESSTDLLRTSRRRLQEVQPTLPFAEESCLLELFQTNKPQLSQGCVQAMSHLEKVRHLKDMATISPYYIMSRRGVLFCYVASVLGLVLLIVLAQYDEEDDEDDVFLGFEYVVLEDDDEEGSEGRKLLKAHVYEGVQVV